MTDKRFGGGSFDDDDEATQFFGGNGSGSRGNLDDDQATEYFGGWDNGGQETEFFGDNSAWGATGKNSAQGSSSPQPSSPDSGNGQGGQYWAPLSDDERGYSDSDFAPTGARAQQPEPQEYRGDGGPGGAGDGGDPGGPSKVRGLSAKGIIGIVALVIIIGLLIWFFVGRGESAPEPTAPPEETTTTEEAPPVPEETLQPEENNGGPLDGELDRFRDELDNLRENPPSIPGLPGGEVTEQVIPEAVGKSPAEVEVNLRRLGFSNVSVNDANGAPMSYTLASVTGTVGQIDPPSGSGVTTDTPVVLTLR